MRKKVLITVSLVRESSRVANEKIEKEIFEELLNGPLKIPWCDKVEKVEVTEA